MPEPEPRDHTQLLSAITSASLPPHPRPHAVLMVALRTDDRHLERRLKAILAVAQTYDDPPNTSAAVTAKYVHELTPMDMGSLEHLFTPSNIKLMNLFDQYPDNPKDSKP